MSRDELAVMNGSKCILQLRGVRPFLSDKYDLTQHPNFKYTADFDKKYRTGNPDRTNRCSSDKYYHSRKGNIKGGLYMAFFNSAVGVLQTLVVALGAGLGIWGAINLLEG